MSKYSERGKYASPEGSRFWEYAAAMICALMIFCVGCIAGWTSPSLSILMKPDSPIPLDSSDASTVSSMVALGHAIAPGLTVVMANKLGRKKSLLVAGVPTIISWGMMVAANNLMVLLIARFIGGLSLGLITCLPAMYLGEIATAKLRGTIGVLCGTMMGVGVLFMFTVGPYLSVKTLAGICLSISIVSGILLWFIPESPYSLAMAGKFEKAEEALEKLRGKSDVSEELEIVKETTRRKAKGHEEGEEGHKAGQRPSAFRQLFTIPANRKSLNINLLFMAPLQFGSFIPTIIYGQIIFEKMKSGISAHFCTMIVAVLQLITNILTAFVIERFGRRPLICISGITSGVCALVIGVYFYLMEYAKVDVTPYSTLAVCTVFVNMIALNFGLVPIQQVVQSEILASEVKGLAVCIIQVAGGIMATIGVKSYLMIADTWGFGHSVPFLGFAANTWLCTALILKLLPETKGKTLLEIQRDLNA